MCAVKVSPEWYTAACKNLAVIEEHAADYEDPSEGEKAPTKEIFDAVKTFFNTLRGKGEDKLEEPRMFVSHEGHLLLSYGNKKQNLDIRFEPTLSYFFHHAENGPSSGSEHTGAVELVIKYFRI